MPITKPMLAVAVTDTATLKYPVLCTPKLDGIRCVVSGGKALSRKFKQIPNHHIRFSIESFFTGRREFDGEIMVPGKTFNEVQSLVMRESGKPDFQYFVFDYVLFDLNASYAERMEDLKDHAETSRQAGDWPDWIRLVTPVPICNEAELIEFERQCLELGYEGVMIRSGDSPYKCGRSTLREGYLLKLKRFSDSEAEIIGFEEQLRNDNELGVNEVGGAKRSSCKAGLVPAGTLGAILARDVVTGVEFSVGTGMDDKIRGEIWASKDKCLGRIFSYRFQAVGMKDKPRFPSFKGFRSSDDFGEV